MDPNDKLSGTCIFRALVENFPVSQTLKFYYHQHINQDEFYTKSERTTRFNDVLRATGLHRTMTPAHIEKAIEKEIAKRDPTPPPRTPKKKPKEMTVTFNYFPKSCTHRYTPMSGTVTGRVFHNFMELFLTPKRFNDLLSRCVIAPIMTYNPREQVVLLERVATAMANGSADNEKKVTPSELIHVFQHFLEIPDVKAILGHEFPVMDEHKWSLHLHMNCSKIDRIRTEIVVAQSDSETPIFVAKFLDLVLLRVIEDHRNYETAYFDNRKMAIKDRMEQLPTSKKSKGKMKPALHFIVFIDGNYEINFETLEKTWPFLNSWVMKSPDFQKSMLQYLEKVFPEKTSEFPCKSALVFCEKFFRWAADTLEFEKTLTYSSRINYGFLERPLDHLIPLRVIHIPTEVHSVSLVFLDDIRHALRRYKAIYKKLDIELSAPHMPGPIPAIHDYLELGHCERSIQSLTKNRVYFELHFGNVMGPYPNLYPLPGPFNKHVVLADNVLASLINTVMIDMRMCYQIDASHPKVQEYVMKLKEYFPVRPNKYFIDLEMEQYFEREAFKLREFKATDTETSIRTSDLETITRNTLTAMYPERNVEEIVAKTMFVATFPQMGDIVHHHFCNSDFCFKNLLVEFTPTFGPPNRDSHMHCRPSVKCNAPVERTLFNKNFQLALL